MTTISVQTGRNYNVIIDSGILNSCGKLIKKISSALRVMIISDSNVYPIYGETVAKNLEYEGYTVFTHIFNAGEQSKTLATVANIYNSLAESNFTRNDLIIALGGGVTGDMAGFAAATYLRGIDFVQIPTSLLAQVDSSVGGKTGVDIIQGKNLIGAFWQPTLVIIDTNVLATLPQKFFTDGMGEIVKYGCIKSSSLFELLEKKDAHENIKEIITECITIKKDIVVCDERESGARMNLNFGHTFGHSLEKIYNFSGLSHGEAISIGMAIITKASENNGLTKQGTYKRLTALLQKLGLPFSDTTDIKTIVANCAGDKKSIDTGINLILIENIGKSYIKKVEKSSLLEFLK